MYFQVADQSPRATYATGARSFASSSAVVLWTTRGGKLHIIAGIPAPGWPGFITTPFATAARAGAPGGACPTIIGDANGIEDMKHES